MTPMRSCRCRRSLHSAVRAVLVMAGTMVWLGGVPAVADVVAPPDTAPAPLDSSALHALRASLAKQPTVRVTGTFRRFDLSGVSVEPIGLRYDDAFRFGADPATLPRSPISWSQIRRIETAETNLGKGLVIGALVGLAAGFLWNAADPPRGHAGFLTWGPTATGVSMGRHIGATVAGTVLGAVVGSTMRKWETVYPTSAPAGRE